KAIDRAGRDDGHGDVTREVDVGSSGVKEREEVLCSRSVQAAEVERHKSREVVARLTHDCAQDLVVKNSVASAYDSHMVTAQGIRREGEAHARREIISVRLVDFAAAIYEAAQARREA